MPFSINLIQNGWGEAVTPVTSLIVRVSPQNFVTFSFNTFSIPSTCPKLGNLNQDHPANPHTIELMPNPLIETRELLSFGHMNISLIEFES